MSKQSKISFKKERPAWFEAVSRQLNTKQESRAVKLKVFFGKSFQCSHASFLVNN